MGKDVNINAKPMEQDMGNSMLDSVIKDIKDKVAKCKIVGIPLANTEEQVILTIIEAFKDNPDYYIFILDKASNGLQPNVLYITRNKA